MQEMGRLKTDITDKVDNAEANLIENAIKKFDSLENNSTHLGRQINNISSVVHWLTSLEGYYSSSKDFDQFRTKLKVCQHIIQSNDFKSLVPDRNLLHDEVARNYIRDPFKH